MKKIMITGLFLLVINSLFSQVKFKIHTGLSHNASYYWLSGASLYSESDFHLGGEFNTQKRSFAVYAMYRFGGYVHPFKNSSPRYYLTPYGLNYSGLGIGGVYRVLGSEKRISPFFQLNVLTEATSRNTYSDFYLTSSLQPTYKDWEEERRYVSTDFIGDLYVGCDFKLMENLSLNLGVGISYRYVRIAHVDNWGSRKYFFSMYGNNARLGLNYTFSVKK